MSNNGPGADQYARNHIEQINVTLEGVAVNIGTLEERISQWKTTTNTALNQLGQWEASNFADRKERQDKLDHELRLLRWGVGIALLLLVVIISLFIGSQLKKE